MGFALQWLVTTSTAFAVFKLLWLVTSLCSFLGLCRETALAWYFFIPASLIIFFFLVAVFNVNPLVSKPEIEAYSSANLAVSCLPD